MEKNEQELINSIIQRNEADANLIVAKVMRITFYLFSFVFLLNILNIFIIDQSDMNLAFSASSIVLLMPTALNKFISEKDSGLKYLYVFFALMFVFVIAITITYHAVVVFIYPVLVASIYVNSRLTRVSAILSVLITSAAQVFGFFQSSLPDANYPNLYDLLVFSVVPKAICMVALSALMILLAKRSDIQVKSQINDTQKIKDLSNQIVNGFMTFINREDNLTEGHIKRTVLYTETLMDGMKKAGLFKNRLNDDFLNAILMCVPIYDIGKSELPAEILQKKDQLTADEFFTVKSHPSRGCAILENYFMNLGDPFIRKTVWRTTHSHHERWNGTGYPERLEGTEIPLEARIIAIIDVFEAISQDRPYRTALPLDECFNIIEEGRCIDFDPDIADVFLSCREQIEAIYNQNK